MLRWFFIWNPSHTMLLSIFWKLYLSRFLEGFLNRGHEVESLPHYTKWRWLPQKSSIQCIGTGIKLGNNEMGIFSHIIEWISFSFTWAWSNVTFLLLLTHTVNTNSLLFIVVIVSCCTCSSSTLHAQTTGVSTGRPCCPHCQLCHREKGSCL